ncbi:MAG: hypothetical protein GY696_21040, partial [Gammaproteobacteria bacterium]|nr:hypothetical protein [Gammaproteobacteria bacterium]
MAPYALAAMVSTGSALLATSAVAGWGASLSATGMLVAGAIGGGLSGLVTTGTLKGAINGALSGAVTAGIGNWGDAAMKAGKYSKMAIKTMKAGMHGIRGGVASVMNGGKFAAGFSSAGMSSFAGGYIGRIENGFGQAVAAGVVGGASSELAGGKFKDGFNEGVITHGLNEIGHAGMGAAEAARQNDAQARENEFIRSSPPKPWSISAGRKWYDRFGNSNVLNTRETDAVRHCGTSCALSNETNPPVSWLLGQSREVFDLRNLEWRSIFANSGSMKLQFPATINRHGNKDMWNNTIGIGASFFIEN